MELKNILLLLFLFIVFSTKDNADGFRGGSKPSITFSGHNINKKKLTRLIKIFSMKFFEFPKKVLLNQGNNRSNKLRRKYHSEGLVKETIIQ